MRRIFQRPLRYMAQVAMCLGLCALLHGTAFATLYGTGKYSSCDYNCPAPPTVVTIPSGLQVAVNLSNGQTIPLSGYGVTVTPLNGQGTSIQKAVFFANGVQVFTGTPDSTGTVHWQWTPGAVGDVALQIVIYGVDGSQTTQNLTLHVVDQTPAPTTATTTPPAKPRATGLAAIPQAIGDAVQSVGQAVNKAIKSVIRHVPAPVVYSFPYILFVLLGVLLLFFALQTRREVRAALRLREIVAGEKHIAEEKETFIQLSEHYLRTPVTLIRGGVDLLEFGGPAATPVAPQVLANLKALSLKLHDNVEAVIARLTSNDLFAGVPAVTDITPAKRLWLSASFLVPVAAMFVLLGFVQYLVQNARELNVTLVNQLVQGIVAAMLLAVFYQVYRRRRLRRQESMALEQALGYQQAIDTTRNDFIRDSAQTLAADSAALAAAVQTLPEGQAKQTLTEGCERFRKVVAQFTIASRLSVGQSQEPAVAVETPALLTEAKQQAAKALAAHGITVHEEVRLPQVRCRQPRWLSYVLGSLIDNAGAYSSQGASVELVADGDAASAHISVRDHGAGIPPETLKDLFQPFVKNEGALQFTHEGLGFSLYLDRLIMAYLGGSISAASEVGKGTTMTVTLPAGT